MAKQKQKKLIGRIEKIDFPDLNLFGIDAKVDTGAYTTAMHCHYIEELEKNGKPVLVFKMLDPTHPNYNEQENLFEEYSKKNIKNSFGESEERFVIFTRIKIGKRTIKSHVSLTYRGSMKYPVLIGRRLLKGRFLVDVKLEYLNKK